MAVPVRLDLLATVDQFGARLTRAAGDAVARRRQRVRDLGRLLPRPEQLLDQARQRFDVWDGRLETGLRGAVQRKRQGLAEAAGGLRPSAMRRGLVQARDRLERWASLLAPALTRQVDRRRDRLADRAGRLLPDRIVQGVARGRGRLDEVSGRLAGAAAGQERARRARLEALERMRETLGYQETLRRGYAVVRGDGAVVTGLKAARAASALEIQFADGRLTIGAAPGPKKARKDPPPDQGSLF